MDRKVPEAIFLKGKTERPNTFAHFCKRVRTAKRRGAVIRITASSYYRLRINGEFVCHGPARSGLGHARVDEYAIEKFLSGDDLFEIEAASYHGAFYTVNEDTNEPGFVYAEIIDGDGVTVDCTDTGWEGRTVYHRDRYAQRHSHCRQVTEVWHLDESYPSPLSLPDEGVETVKCPELKERGVPYPTFEKIKASAVTDAGVLEYDADKHVDPLFFDAWDEKYAKSGERVGDEDMKLVRSAASADITYGDGITFGASDGIKFISYDLLSMYVGFIDLDITLSCGAAVDVVYSDRLEPDGDIAAQIGYNTCIRVYCQPGRTRFTSFEPYAMRYMKVIVRTDKAFTLHGAGIVSYAPEDTHGGTFLCSDERLNNIYNAARKTLLLNTLDIFMDCPDRERGGWLCDSLWTARAAYLMLSDSSVERAMIENFLDYPADQCYYGFFPQCYPATGDFKNGSLTTWSFWFVIEIGEYFRRTGDRQLIDRCRPRLEAFFDGVKKLCGEHGLFESHSTVFVDWSLSNEHDYVYPISCAANVIYACALEVFDTLYGSEDAREHAERIRKTLQKHALDRGEYDPRYILHDSLDNKDGTLTGKPYFSESAQYTMLWGGLFDKDSCGGLIDAVVNELGPIPRRKPPKLDIGAANMFIGLCIRLDMLSMLGYPDVMLDEIKYLCDTMLSGGPGTLWETVSGSASRCHGFMSHVGVLLTRDILGLDVPRSYPSKKIVIKPYLSDLKFAQGTARVPEGIVSVFWRFTGAEFELRVNAPDAYALELTLPAQVRGFSAVKINGEEIDPRGVIRTKAPLHITAKL